MSCEALTEPETVEHDIHAKLAREYIDAVEKQNLVVNYDPISHNLMIRWGSSPFEKSEDCGEYVLDRGTNGSIIGIHILKIYIG